MVIITEDINAQDTVLANNGLQVLLAIKYPGAGSKFPPPIDLRLE
jgi:hypothetical protein